MRNLQYELKVLQRDKEITNQAVDAYKVNIVDKLPPVEEMLTPLSPPVEEKNIKKTLLEKLISIF